MASSLIKPFHRISIIDPLPAEVAGPAQWVPILNVKLIHGSRGSLLFPAYADSGSSFCIFRAGIGRLLNIPFETGHSEFAHGVTNAMKERVYFFPIELEIERRWKINIQAAFMENLAVPGILGTAGFFENFRVCFDHSTEPPLMEVTLIEAAKS